MNLKKNLLFLFSIALVLGCFSCSDSIDDDNENLSPNLKSVNALIKSGGKLAVSDEYESITATVDTAKTTVGATVNGVMQECYSIGVTESYDVNRNPDDFVMMNPWTDVIWPGALIQGGSLRDDNVPAGVPIYKKRLPGRIFLGLVSGNENMDEWYKETELRPANVTQSMNDLMKTYLGKSTPAYTSFKIETVHSIEEMALKLGIDFKMFGGKLKSDFGTNWREEKSYVAVHLKQQFFTMAYEGPDGGIRGTFTDDITKDDLESFTGPGNPLCYVSSVTYGRSFVMLYESSSSVDSLGMALSVGFSGYNSNNSFNAAKVMNESKCTMTQIGGDPVAGLGAVFGNFDKLRSFIEEGAKVSADNVGAPISFKINTVYDNTPARLSNMLKFSFTQKIFTPVLPKNNVEFNIFDAYMPAPTTNRKVSNHSRFQIKRIRVGHSKTGQITIAEGGEYHTFLNYKSAEVCQQRGATIPIYRSFTLSAVPKNHKIRIECDVYVKNQTYGGPTKVGENTYTLIRDFEYDSSKNSWIPVNPKDKNDPKAFRALYLSNEPLSDTKFDFDLNFRFKCDNYPYPLNGR